MHDDWSVGRLAVMAMSYHYNPPLLSLGSRACHLCCGSCTLRIQWACDCSQCDYELSTIDQHIVTDWLINYVTPMWYQDPLSHCGYRLLIAFSQPWINNHQRELGIRSSTITSSAEELLPMKSMAESTWQPPPRLMVKQQIFIKLAVVY